jgi:hypothetical protein
MNKYIYVRIKYQYYARTILSPPGVTHHSFHFFPQGGAALETVRSVDRLKRTNTSAEECRLGCIMLASIFVLHSTLIDYRKLFCVWSCGWMIGC